jgi:DNA repair protein RadA/Sms
MLLSGRPKNISGNCAVCVLEGTRPVITEIQALTAQSVYPTPKRTSDGIDYNRTGLILAVLEKRLGLRFSTQDVYVNVTGGLRLDEPASDLALALSLISSIKDRPLSYSLAAFGELGLAGECRAVNNAEIRISEAEKLGFESVVIPDSNYQKIKKAGNLPENVELIPIKSIFDALKIFG